MAARVLIALAIAVVAPAAAGASAAVRLRWVPSGPGEAEGEVRVEGLDGESLARLGDGSLEAALGERLLRIVVVPADGEGAATARLPNLWGEWYVGQDELRFRPRHALAPGVVLAARFDGVEFDRRSGAAGTPVLELRHVEAAGVAATRVVSADPGGEEIPANLLRIYLHFSAPMSMRDVERHVHLLDEAGGEIPLAFVDVPGGLWDPGRRRLSLFVHPGRLKRGVAPRERLGEPFAVGSIVRLRVDAAARDADGRPLAAAFERRWRVAPPRRQPLDPGLWEVHPPGAPAGPLAIDFGRPLDRGLALAAIQVVDRAGVAVDGRAELEAGERRWRFVPRAPWAVGEPYRVVFGDALEDPSGNRLGRSFERAVGEGTAPVERQLVFVPTLRSRPAPPASVSRNHSAS